MTLNLSKMYVVPYIPLISPSRSPVICPLFQEDGKPVWEDDIDLGDIILPDSNAKPKSKKQKKKEERRKAKAAAAAAENGGEAVVDEGEMDAEMEGPEQSYLDDDEEWDGTEEMRKRKLNEYMDQVYGLDFNDVVRLSPAACRCCDLIILSHNLRSAATSPPASNTPPSKNPATISPPPRSSWRPTPSSTSTWA